MQAHQAITLRRQDPREEVQLASTCALVSAGILFTMCAIVLFTGTSQQAFETFSEPDAYARGLVEGARALRAIHVLDVMFITGYVTSTILFLRWLSARAPSPLHRVVLGMVLVAGTLDLLENHHILTMLRGAELGILPTVSEIAAQMVGSSTKWVLGHIAFALIGVSLQSSALSVRLFRFALIAVQLPLGILTWTQTDASMGMLLEWLRYGNTMFGFVAIAWFMHQGAATSHASDAAGLGAPA